ncbi:MAG: nucleoside phosphorylase [Bacteroidia bacterium]
MKSKDNFEPSTVSAKKISDSELILNADGSIFHLHLHPSQLADTILLVGDPGRVSSVSKHFSQLEHSVSNREFVTHTGIFNGKRISVISTGIGTDNIDIVVNELDALVNIDLSKRIPLPVTRSLNLIRLGTSGSLQKDIDTDTFLVSSHGLGMDGLLNFYGNLDAINEKELSDAFIAHTHWNKNLAFPYIVAASPNLLKLLGKGYKSGITATAPGFYGPQGRVLRIPLAVPEMNEAFTSFDHKGVRITNFEMETSALYGLSKHLGHEACTVCAIIANRLAGKYSKDYKATVDKMIEMVLERLTTPC